tara:strand:+ start:873 stop:1202 length:330 start_codon:yes stop_codon:yes gene_type:complete
VAFDYWTLILVLLGLVSGFMNSEIDPVRRMILLIAAIGLPVVAKQLNATPVVRGYVSSITDIIVIAISGIVIFNFIMVIVDSRLVKNLASAIFFWVIVHPVNLIFRMAI